MPGDRWVAFVSMATLRNATPRSKLQGLHAREGRATATTRCGVRVAGKTTPEGKAYIHTQATTNLAANHSFQMARKILIAADKVSSIRASRG